MTTSSDDRRFGNLIDALRAVAADPETQEAALPELRAVAEQIRRGAPQGELLDVTLAREGVLPAEVGFLIQRIDELFDQLVALEPERAFSRDGLRELEAWKLMRGLAREALQQLGLTPRRGQW
ncbi:MAG: hypothetical protein OXT09_26490 [Myxococcales bacterium]|nr:hypothetical protein [Myxococcales bacterium]